MSESVVGKYKEILDSVGKYLKESNFTACDKMALDLIRLSYYFDFSDGMFFAECMEHIFDNLEDLNEEYELSEKETKEIIDRNLNFIIALKESIGNLKNIKELYELLRDARKIVTTLQMKYARTQVRKRRFPGIGFVETGTFG